LTLILESGEVEKMNELNFEIILKALVNFKE